MKKIKHIHTVKFNCQTYWLQRVIITIAKYKFNLKFKCKFKFNFKFRCKFKFRFKCNFKSKFKLQAVVTE